jgi:hypothetical protein
MFMLNGQPLALDTAFTHNDIQYPANWLRLATPEEREAIGVTEAPDPEVYDDRFYWGPNNPKAMDDVYVIDEVQDTRTLQSTGLRTQAIQRVKETAHSMLAPTDWAVLRQLQKGIGMSARIENFRNAVVEASNNFETQINACTTVDELAALQLTWPNQKDF